MLGKLSFSIYLRLESYWHFTPRNRIIMLAMLGKLSFSIYLRLESYWHFTPRNRIIMLAFLFDLLHIIKVIIKVPAIQTIINHK